MCVVSGAQLAGAGLARQTSDLRGNLARRKGRTGLLMLDLDQPTRLDYSGTALEGQLELHRRARWRGKAAGLTLVRLSCVAVGTVLAVRIVLLVQLLL